jgi:gamma-butyrobetaine dioxygenase
MPVFEQIVELFEARGNTIGAMDLVSQKDHALQTAALAVAEGAPEELVLAALLHDIGHLLPQAETPGSALNGNRHEERGAKWLAGSFGREITEPVRLHVEAKRYLCALDLNYIQKLSPGALHRLKTQGGPLSRSEAEEFQANPYHREALYLRHFDDRAKIPGWRVSPLAHYRDLIESLCLLTWV